MHKGWRVTIVVTRTAGTVYAVVRGQHSAPATSVLDVAPRRGTTALTFGYAFSVTTPEQW